MDSLKLSLKVAAVLPAYENEATVAQVLKAIPREYFEHIILVDNNSKDRTFEIACQDKSILAFRNERNLGYGGNLKRGFGVALDLGADIIIEIHADGEYGVESIGAAIHEIKKGAGLVLGNRFAPGLDPLKSGMFYWKYPSIRAMNWIANRAMGTSFGDLHQGFRVYSAKFLKSVDYKNNDNDYLFSFEIIAQAIFYQFLVQQVPQRCQYSGKRRGSSFVSNIGYSISVFGVLMQFFCARAGLSTPLFPQRMKT